MKKKSQKMLVIPEQEWSHVHDLVANTVVQVFAHIAEFNWLESYKCEREYEQSATGFFINNKGHVVTNAHVVHQARRIWLQMPVMGHRNIYAKVIGFAPDHDIALLALEDHDLQEIKRVLGDIAFLPFGNSDRVDRSDNVLTLGYPLGQFHVKSASGIVSGREFFEGMTLLQVTAPVNPGNSGGPLLNSVGHVIGIITASVMEASNVGFAIPSNDFLAIVDQLYEKKFVRKPIFGLRFNVVDDTVGTFLGNPLPVGAYINCVFTDSLASDLGMQEGDMLYACNTYTVDGFVEVAVPWSQERIPFHDLVARFKEGDSIEIVVYRAGKRLVKKTVFKSMKPYAIRFMYPDYEEVAYEVIAGMVCMELKDNHFSLLLEESPHLHYYEQIEHKREPVVVITHILAGSAAQQLRSLSPGDTLEEVNGMPITSLASLRTALLKSKQQPYISIITQTRALTVFLCAEVMADEQRLADDYGYHISPTVQEIRKVYIHGTKKTT